MHLARRFEGNSFACSNKYPSALRADSTNTGKVNSIDNQGLLRGNQGFAVKLNKQTTSAACIRTGYISCSRGFKDDKRLYL